MYLFFLAASPPPSTPKLSDAPSKLLITSKSCQHGDIITGDVAITAKVSANLETLTLEVAPLCKADLTSTPVHVVTICSLNARLTASYVYTEIHSITQIDHTHLLQILYFMFCIIEQPSYYICTFVLQTLRLKLGWTVLKLKSVLSE